MRTPKTETTLLELVCELGETLQDDQAAVDVAIELIRRGWVRTRDGQRLALGAAIAGNTAENW